MATFKPLDRTGLNVSSVEVSESVRPAVEYRPAPWLPVKYYDTKLEDWIVIVSGEPVAAVRPLINRGAVTDLVPFNVLSGFSYTQQDVDAGVIDVRTGQALVSGGIGAVATADIETALGHNAGDLAAAKPIGIASYNCMISADRGYLNYDPQERVAVTCDYVIEVPVLAGAVSTITGYPVAATLAGNAFGLDNTSGAGGTVIATPAGVDLNTARVTINGTIYANATVADNAGNIEVTATIDVAVTDVIEISFPVSPLLGGLPVFDPGTLTQGAVIPSIFVKVDNNNNFVPWVAGTDDASDIVGQVIGVDNDFPKDFLERVRTWYPSDMIAKAYRGPSDARLWATPGSATGGLNDRLYRALGTAYSGTVKINLLK